MIVIIYCECACDCYLRLSFYLWWHVFSSIVVYLPRARQRGRGGALRRGIACYSIELYHYETKRGGGRSSECWKTKLRFASCLTRLIDADAA